MKYIIYESIVYVPCVRVGTYYMVMHINIYLFMLINCHYYT